jgi:hypothetical protein
LPWQDDFDSDFDQFGYEHQSPDKDSDPADGAGTMRQATVTAIAKK